MGDYKHEKMINAEFVWYFILLVQFMVVLIMVMPFKFLDKLGVFLVLQFLIVFILCTQWQQIKRIIKMAE